MDLTFLIAYQVKKLSYVNTQFKHVFYIIMLVYKNSLTNIYQLKIMIWQWHFNQTKIIIIIYIFQVQESKEIKQDQLYDINMIYDVEWNKNYGDETLI